MARHTPTPYDKDIWNQVKLKALSEKPSHVSVDSYIELQLKIGESSVDRANRGDIKWTDSTRWLLLNYLGYSSVEEFAAEKKNITPAQQLPARETLRYNMPPRPDYCIGREEELSALHNLLNSAPASIVLLRGVGGMGKTTLMQEYLHRQGADTYYDRIIVITVNGDLQGAFVKGANNALKLGAETAILQEDKLDIVVNGMQQLKGNNLFVVDNINEQDHRSLVMMRSYFAATQWTYLVTTRTAPDGFVEFPVLELGEEAATLLFVYHYVRDKSINRKDVTALEGYISKYNLKRDIHHLLDHTNSHTLLVELLGRVGNKRQLSVPHLLKHLQEEDFRHPGLRHEITIGSHADNTFRKELTISTLEAYLLSLFDIRYLQEEGVENEQKLTALRYFSILPHEDIELPDLKELWNVPGEEEVRFENRLEVLKQEGWLQGKERKRADQKDYLLLLTYKMHELVQQVVHNKLKPDVSNCSAIIRHLTMLVNEKRTSGVGKKYRTYAAFMLECLHSLQRKKKVL